MGQVDAAAVGALTATGALRPLRLKGDASNLVSFDVFFLCRFPIFEGTRESAKAKNAL